MVPVVGEHGCHAVGAIAELMRWMYLYSDTGKYSARTFMLLLPLDGVFAGMPIVAGRMGQRLLMVFQRCSASSDSQRAMSASAVASGLMVWSQRERRTPPSARSGSL